MVPGLIGEAVYHHQQKKQDLNRLSQVNYNLANTWTPDSSVIEARKRFFKIVKAMNNEAMLNDIVTSEKGFSYKLSKTVSVLCYHNSPYLVIEDNLQERLAMSKDEIKDRILFGCDDHRGFYININYKVHNTMQLQISVPASQTQQTETLNAILVVLKDLESHCLRNDLIQALE